MSAVFLGHTLHYFLKQGFFQSLKLSNLVEGWPPTPANLLAATSPWDNRPTLPLRLSLIPVPGIQIQVLMLTTLLTDDPFLLLPQKC